MERLRIGVLISGGGTNLQAIIDACKTGEINAKVAVVISNKKDAFGLERAKKEDIDAIYIAKNSNNNEDYELEVLNTLKEHKVELVVLAGYLKVVSPKVIEAYKNRIINIHPSLIPKHCGKGYYGIRVHQSVIKAKDKESGATVHFVDEGTDTGEIILQESIALLENETAESLQKRVLELEHKLLIKAIRAFTRA